MTQEQKNKQVTPKRTKCEVLFSHCFGYIRPVSKTGNPGKTAEFNDRKKLQQTSPQQPVDAISFYLFCISYIIQIMKNLLEFKKTSLIELSKKNLHRTFYSRCNFFLWFCHNPELVKRSCYLPPMDNNEILFLNLNKRKKTIDAVYQHRRRTNHS
jgi:hypothetical protein